MNAGNDLTPQRTITKQVARKFLLDHHFLLPARKLSPDQITKRLFDRLGCIQFDTINVVGRNADLVLQSRIRDYRPEILDRLLYQDRELMDGWDKVASIYPTQDWPYFERHRKKMGTNAHKRSSDASLAAEKILRQIGISGPMSSLEFKDTTKTDWAWGPTSVARAALEILYFEGKLGISHRVNTRRHFDLIERLVPADVLNTTDPNQADRDYQDWHVLRRIGGLGLASPKSGEHWLGIYGGRKVSDRQPVLKRLVQQEKLIELKIENLEDQSFYIRKDDLPQLEKLNPDPTPNSAAFLAPLDNLLWNRKKIRDIFDFSYTWEVYKPKTKREYGYYVLPVLYRDNFIARVDMKFDRKTNTLTLINWWWESDIELDDEMASAILKCMEDFIQYLGATAFMISPDDLQAPEIKHVFKNLE